MKLSINGTEVEAAEGQNVLEAALDAGIYIPHLCKHPDLEAVGGCRLCMVEVEGTDGPVCACKTPVAEGMVVYTNSPRVREARRVNLRLLLSQHDTKCTKCTRSGNCKLQQLTNDYNLLGDHYIDDLKNIPTDYSNPVVRIENRCVKCMRCIQVCEKIQGMGIWDLMGTGTRTTVGVAHTRTLGESDCTFCGQCITHCPVGGLQEHDDTGKVFDALANKDRITVVQVAPAVRAAWAEFYHLDPKFATAERMVTALKTMGFDYVFDTNFAADLTIMEEGSEFIERFTHRNKYHWPMFTSCCPGWVRFLKGQFPSYTENLSTAKSPQQMFGAVAKSYFAQKIGVDPKKLFVVSIMPCTAKKAECALPTMKDEQGDPDVDVVLTTREIVRMLRGEQINPAVLPETPFDSPLGTGTGGPGYCIKGEFAANGVQNDLRHTRGVLSMARAQPMNSAGSQFFIMHKDAPHLDGQYAAFGCVMDGMDVVDRIANQPRNMMTNKPKKDQVMAKVTVDTQGVTYPEPEKLADPFGR